LAVELLRAAAPFNLAFLPFEIENIPIADDGVSFAWILGRFLREAQDYGRMRM
jgi:hypothetical protein